MRVLRIEATGLSLFTGKVEIDFLAQQRVAQENTEKMYPVYNNYYQNNVLAVVGINASGKTSLLKVIAFVLQMANNVPINSIDCREILGNLDKEANAEIRIYFCASGDTIWDLHTVIAQKEDHYFIKEETLKEKAFAKIKTKKSLFDFEKADCVQIRNQEEEFLLDDVSIMVAFHKRHKDQCRLIDMLRYTNVNQLNVNKNCPSELIAFFDPSVEYLHMENNGKDSDICLKFKHKEEIRLRRSEELNRYLSSGTIKGINTFMNAMGTFETGGYLIVDEVENHFNKEIVSTLIRFFMDRRVNPKGAVLVFSTHYAELLDEFERNDNIYIVRNRLGITAENLSRILKRNDIKKSDAYQSGFLEGTVPTYEAYMDLKRVLLER